MYFNVIFTFCFSSLHDDSIWTTTFQSLYIYIYIYASHMLLVSRHVYCSLDLLFFIMITITFVASLLLGCIDSLLPSLTYLINNSLQSATLPSEFCKRNTSLIPSNLKNNRHVLNLPCPSKLLKQVILQLTEHVNKNNLTHTVRSAYRSGHSMGTVRLRVSWPSPILMLLFCHY